jgi:uncharacterized protein
MQLIVAAISLGILGSFHCIGMCGPIALALPVRSASPLKKFLLILVYNSGRVITYSAFGLLAGIAGKGFVTGGYQQALSIIIGAILLTWAIAPSTLARLSATNKYLYTFYGRLRSALSGLFIKKGIAALLFTGILNGLLPCGLVYMALAMAMATGSVATGAIFMALFGAGTIPVMMTLPLAGSLITTGFRSWIRKSMRPLIAATALLLIIRGLNLGIPYMSPKAGDEGSCHQQPAKTTACQAGCCAPDLKRPGTMECMR